MSEDNGIQRLQEVRFQALKTMYTEAMDSSRPAELAMFSALEIAPQIDADVDEVASALVFLREEGLLKLFSVRGNNREYGYVITHEGKKEVESALAQPDRGTKYFSSHLINQTLNFNGTVGAVQTGSNAVANIDQKMGVDVASIIAVINELKQQVQELPEATRDEASDALELIDDELAGTRDKKRIRVAFNWLKTNVSGSVDFTSRLAVLAKHLNDLNVFDR